MTSLAKISSKSQVTIPLEVRKALSIKQGDVLAWELAEGGTAIIHRASPLDIEYIRAVESTLSEWNSPEDEEAYRGL